MYQHKMVPAGPGNVPMQNGTSWTWKCTNAKWYQLDWEMYQHKMVPAGHAEVPRNAKWYQLDMQCTKTKWYQLDIQSTNAKWYQLDLEMYQILQNGTSSAFQCTSAKWYQQHGHADVPSNEKWYQLSIPMYQCKMVPAQHNIVTHATGYT